MSDIEVINRADRTAVTDDGRVGTITNLFDADGDETDNIEDAITAVIRLADDEWYTIALEDYETARMEPTAKIVSIADRRPDVCWTVHITQDWKGYLSVRVEEISEDVESRKRAAGAMRRAADLIEFGEPQGMN